MKTREQIRKEAEEKYQQLQFRDDFLFCKILTERPDIAKELLELILNVRIEKVVPQKQKSIEITAEGRGIRLDVYLDDEEGTVYDLEMQTTKKTDLPKRTRYYQGMIDLDLINRGAKFRELKKSYIIFICTEDPFDEGRHIYSFENVCKENPERKLGDEAYKVLLNASGTQNDVSDNLLDFFRLILTGEGNSELSRKIEGEVEKARQHEEWRIEYMTLYMRDQEKIEEGIKIGREEGREEGREAERTKMIQKLISKNYTKEQIFDLGYTEAEYVKAEELF